VRSSPEHSELGRPAPETALALQRTAGNAAFAEWAAGGLAGSQTRYTEEQPGPVSQVLPAPGPSPPAPAPLVVCTITTRTVAAAPDGTPDSRIKVGANEEVQMTSSVPADWTASDGTVAPVIPGPSAVAFWVAPLSAGLCTITATPLFGPPCTVTMMVARPTSRTLTIRSMRPYVGGRAGSGFEATVVVNPTDVSLSRLEVREEAVAATATGYYDIVLRWNRKMHTVGSWLPLNAANSGVKDEVGTNPPGSPPPFGAGTFTWPIPQSFRARGGGPAIEYSTGEHVQVMLGPKGDEVTSKEGAMASRTP
jgi:hypothetical protein